MAEKSSKSSSSTKPRAKSSSTKAPKASASSKTTATRSASAAAKTGSSKGKRKPPAPNMQERMEGLQGWMAEIEKKQERSSRFGTIAVILAILAAGGALALGVINKQDGATKDDVDELTTKVNELGASVEQQTEKQLKGINQRLSALEPQIDSLTKQQRQTEAQINTLQSNATAAPAPAAPKSKP